MKNICIFSSSSDAIQPEYFEAAQKLAELLTKTGYHLVYGGAKIGLMGIVAKKFKEAGGKVTGIIPEALKLKEIYNPDCDELVVTQDMRERKALMDELSDAFIALPGGFGTLEEITEHITMKQLGYHNKPIVFLNTKQFYNGLLDFFETLYIQKFAKENYRQLYFVASEPEEIIEYLKDYSPFQMPDKWF